MEEKKTDYVKDKIINVSSIKLELSQQDTNSILKVRVLSDVGDITWKAKKKQTRFISGFPTEQMRPMTIDEIPQKLKDIQNVCTNDAICTVKAEYTVMNTKDAEGMPVTYRFFVSEKTLDKWEIQEKPKPKIEKETVQ